MSKRAYALESENEFQRLEKQSESPHYNYRDELKDLNLRPGIRVLDAGTGSGLVARYLAHSHPQITVVGIDSSEDRVKQATAHSSILQNLSFLPHDLTTACAPGDTYDIVICRYVLQHLKAGERYRAALANIFASINEGGTIHIIETDGLLQGLSPMSADMGDAVARIVSNDAVELNMGRRLPYLLNEAGFEEIQCRSESHVFQGNELAEERELMAQRFAQAEPLFINVLGSTQLAKQFIGQYLSVMTLPHSLYHHNKFLVTARKPHKDLPRVSVLRGHR